MKIFDGRQAADRILSQLKKDIQEIGVKPKLAIILVGKDKASRLYIKLKKLAAEKIGVEVVEYIFKENAKEETIIQTINGLNMDKAIDGIIVQLSLPKGFDKDKITGAIVPEKDVDGFHKDSHFPPVLPSAILFALRTATKDLNRKKILALVHSERLGETLKDFLKKETAADLQYALIKKTSHLKHESDLKRADVIITVLGEHHLIKGRMVKDGVILIDAGIPSDVDRENVKGKAAFLTPNPGGIGPLTVALLLKNVYSAANRPNISKKRSG